ncbi:MAG: hypothetical protein HYS17_07030 [Micavibrio aeruginosavorus]|uniref:Uncharacterized protein n=1 Tax=Micavibrio aeruginosavorus TaxID=349221 RepID=A0A7T5UGG1_9BACT|nr:MAG: hypothetical protein HYS17_07030 [Micavibrio aeruginosavorus]
MNEIDPTFLIALRVWWAWCWRAILLALGAAFVFGFIVGLAGAAVGLDKNSITYIGGAGGFVLGLFFSVHVMKRILKKSFGHFRIALIRQ